MFSFINSIILNLLSSPANSSNPALISFNSNPAMIPSEAEHNELYILFIPGACKQTSSLFPSKTKLNLEKSVEIFLATKSA